MTLKSRACANCKMHSAGVVIFFNFLVQICSLLMYVIAFLLKFNWLKLRKNLVKYIIGQKPTKLLLVSTLAWLNHKGPSHSTSEVASAAATASLWRLKRRPWKQELAIGYNMARCQVSPIGLSRSYLLQLEAFSIHHASFGIADIRWKFNPLYSITSSLTTTESIS